MQLNEFLVLAKQATYANEERKAVTLPSGAKELTFEKDAFKYVDVYVGFNPFSGQEVVFEKDSAIWALNYYGKITDTEISQEEVYTFLRTALSQVTSDAPFRGPLEVQEGDFIYTNFIEDDLDEFYGQETIIFKNKEVYHLEYHGGEVKNKE